MGPEVDGRANIYAVGCVAYWRLTGQFVFTAETRIGAHPEARPDSAPTSFHANRAAYPQGSR